MTKRTKVNMSSHISKLRDSCRVIFSILSLFLAGAPSLSAQTSSDQFDAWSFWGGNISNTHSNPFERTLTTKNVCQLKPKWTFTTGGDVSVEFGGKIYVGVSSNQELLAATDPKFVLSFIGSVASLDAQTDHIEWQTFMAPAGYTGNAVWGSNFSIDAKRQSLYIATDPDTGATIWATLVGPGGTTGGIEWGSATDGSKIYVAINNSSNISYKLAPAHTVTVNAGSWAALDPATGNIIWQIPATGQNPLNPELGAGALGQMSAAAGVVYAGSLSGDMVAIDGNTGDILWKFASGGSVICGPSIVDGTVFWGSGYSHIGAGTGNNKLFAFSLGKGSVGKHNGGAQ